MAVPNTNVKLKAEIADECKVVQTTDISPKYPDINPKHP